MKVRAVYFDRKGVIYVAEQEGMKRVVLWVTQINNSMATLKISRQVNSERSVLNEVFKLR
jgi:hypothetical protein